MAVGSRLWYKAVEVRTAASHHRQPVITTNHSPLLAMGNLLLITLTILVAIAEGVFGQGCEPDCSAGAIGDFMGSLCDCSEYYVCLSNGVPSDVPLTCPPEAPYFDPAINGCGNDPSVCPITSPDPSLCPVTCTDPAAMEQIVDPSDCSQFYFCDGTSLEPQGPVPCSPDTPVFNGAECVTDPNECCAGSSSLCLPYCAVVGTQIIDPTNCTEFYICITVGPANELYHTQCPSGQNFDITSATCLPDAACITLCESNGRTTTSGGGGDCVESMECTVAGAFPKCTSCQQQYFYCLSNEGEALVMECTGDMVFNTDSSYPYCVSPNDCPHLP